jgi:hypothetical protein
VKDGGLRPLFRTKLPAFHWQSVESLSTGNGTPDANYCFGGVEGWIEFKRTEGDKIKSLKPEQVAWAERRARAGGLSFFAVRRDFRDRGSGDHLFLIRGSAARSLLGGLSSIPQGSSWSWGGGPRSWDWAQIALILTTRPSPRS